MSQDLLEALKDGVAVLTLNRPDRLNAMSPSMLDALLEALPRLAADPEVGVVVLMGAGRAFCAGGDVKAMAEGREFGGTTLEDKAQALRSRMEVSRWLHEMPKPTIAMVRGAAAGAGLSLALACDLRVAGDTARFATAFARVGYSGDFGGSWFLTQLVGTSWTPARRGSSGWSTGSSLTRASRRKRWRSPHGSRGARGSPTAT